MKHMERKYKKEDAMLRTEHESTLEKNQNTRMRRRKMLEDSINKAYKSELDPTLD